jgi:hypothetical protein
MDYFAYGFVAGWFAYPIVHILRKIIDNAIKATKEQSDV